jgi:DNA polymerase I-like protein with 3'-5' exonuclease and polymerase domains
MTVISSADKLKLRSMFIPAPGKLFVACDFSQAETWIVAHLAFEDRMKKALMFGDIHTQTAASAIFFPLVKCETDHAKWNKLPNGDRACPSCGVTITEIMRYLGKRFNHAKSYRMGDERAAEVINADSDQPPYVTITTAQAREYGSNWLSYYQLAGWWRRIEDQLRATRTLRTTYGRERIFFDDLYKNGKLNAELAKEATAYEPQSTVADHANGVVHPELGVEGGFKTVYRKIVKPSHGGIKAVNVAHDSMMLEVPKEQANEIGLEVVSILKRPLVVNGEMFTIPVDLEIGERWGELEKIKLAA